MERFARGTPQITCALLSTLLVAGCSGAGSSSSPNALNGVTPSVAARSAVVGGPYSSLVLAANPAAYYQLSDSGATLTDAGTNAINGTLGSSVVHNVQPLTSEPNVASGFPGGAYTLNGAGFVAPNANFQTGSGITVEAWIVESALNSSHTDVPLVAYGMSPGYAYELMIGAQNQLRFRVHTGGPATYYSAYGATPLQPGKAYHVVGTYDGATVSVYVNGVLNGSISATGGLHYGSVAPSSGGLVIGGAFGASNPLFGGDAEDVALYQRSLASSDVAAHYNAGLATPALHETPAQADAFVDTIGVNTHFHYQGSAYTTNYATIKSMLLGSGIRHIREGLYGPSWLTYYSELNDLAAAGVHSLLGASLGTSASDIATLPAQYYASSMEAFEGPNEPDLGTDPNWVADTRAFQKLLYTTLKANPATARYPVYAPAIVTAADATELGTLSGYVDDGNTHDYFGGYNPGNPGYGSIGPFGYYGSVSFFENVAAQVSGAKPIVSTETGYNTSGAGNISQLAEEKYALRTYFVHFNSGILRTYRYEMIDESTPGPPSMGGSGFNYMGLLNSSLQPKPSYNALKGLIAALSDRGSSFAPTPLSYTLAGSITNLDHALLEKRDGTYCLALWLEVPSWNLQTMSDISVPAQSIQLRLPFNPASASLTTFNAGGNAASAALAFASGTASVPVADQIVLIQFHP
jgi:hypothetical protein